MNAQGKPEAMNVSKKRKDEPKKKTKAHGPQLRKQRYVSDFQYGMAHKPIDKRDQNVKAAVDKQLDKMKKSTGLGPPSQK